MILQLLDLVPGTLTGCVVTKENKFMMNRNRRQCNNVVVCTMISFQCAETFMLLEQTLTFCYTSKAVDLPVTCPQLGYCCKGSKVIWTTFDLTPGLAKHSVNLWAECCNELSCITRRVSL